MEKRFVTALMVFCILAFCCSRALADEVSGPVVKVDNREFDFGEVKEGQSLEHTFKIFNKGDQELEIISVRPG